MLKYNDQFLNKNRENCEKLFLVSKLTETIFYIIIFMNPKRKLPETRQLQSIIHTLNRDL